MPPQVACRLPCTNIALTRIAIRYVDIDVERRRFHLFIDLFMETVHCLLSKIAMPMVALGIPVAISVQDRTSRSSS
jgi:hypothetical protein